MLQLDFQWPKDLPLVKLRQWIIHQLKNYGEPLRWAITSIDSPKSNPSNRQLKVEAVVIVLE